MNEGIRESYIHFLRGPFTPAEIMVSGVRDIIFDYGTKRRRFMAKQVAFETLMKPASICLCGLVLGVDVVFNVAKKIVRMKGEI